MRRELERFDPTVSIDQAVTPPASWYTNPGFLQAETPAVFGRSWQPIARLDQLASPGDYVAGEVAGDPCVVVRDGEHLRAFFNVCRHHASCIVEGQGNVERLICPYHGWTYELNGRLCKAPRLGAVRGFDREQFGLVPLEVDTWGPFVFVRIHAGGPSLQDHLAPLDGRIDCSSLRFVKRVNYEINCNWKVFIDNYLDGGYHVDRVHTGLASQLDLESYRTEIEDRVSLQICASNPESTDGHDFKDRIGEGAVYAYIYPNLMINRYGPIMDTNWVVPLGHERTLTVFDYYFDSSAVERDPGLVDRSLVASDRVQQEDIVVCESVQRGLRSSAYDTGRYAPDVEQAAYHFHGLLARDLRQHAGPD